MIEIFGPNTVTVVRLIAQILELEADDIDQVATAWRASPAEDRAAAWNAVRHAATLQEAEAIRNAAAVARHQALTTALARDRHDWAFWSAASDAAGALAADWAAVDVRAYRVLVSPMATTLEWLLGQTGAPWATRHSSRLGVKSVG